MRRGQNCSGLLKAGVAFGWPGALQLHALVWLALVAALEESCLMRDHLCSFPDHATHVICVLSALHAGKIMHRTGCVALSMPRTSYLQDMWTSRAQNMERTARQLMAMQAPKASPHALRTCDCQHFLTKPYSGSHAKCRTDIALKKLLQSVMKGSISCTSAIGLLQAFVAIMMMMSWSCPPRFADRSYDLIELFAGQARITRLARARGWYAMNHDWDYDHFATENGTNNCMDLCGNAGFLHLTFK